MNWKDVGEWIKSNAGTGAALVGSLITGNVPGAVAAGVAMVSSATGSSDPATALAALQTDPTAVIRLKELAVENDANVRKHLEEMTRLSLEDKQKEHESTQLTIRNGDNSTDVVVRRTRPLQSWLSLCAAIAYVFIVTDPDTYILGLLLTLPFGYSGFRQFGKAMDTHSQRKVLEVSAGTKK